MTICNYGGLASCAGIANDLRATAALCRRYQDRVMAEPVNFSTSMPKAIYGRLLMTITASRLRE